MHAVMTWVAATAVSIGAGWEKLPNGGYEYIIQIEPEAIAPLEAGEELTSEIPPEVRDVRSYRIRVGRAPLPRDSGMTLPIGSPPAGTELQIGSPPNMSPNTAPTTAPPGSAAAPPGSAAVPATPDPAAHPDEHDATQRRVGIHAEDATGAEGAPYLADFKEGKVGDSTSGPGPSSGGSTTGGDGEKPKAALWPPLLGSLLALFASVGGNVFLGWTTVAMRGRYKALLAHQQLA